MEEEANKYFSQLLKIYSDLPIKDHSFVSNAVNLFTSSFVAMIGEFLKAGIDFQRVLPSKCKITEVAIQDFIQHPTKDKPFLPQETWNIFSNDTIAGYNNLPMTISPSVFQIDNAHLEIEDDIIIHNSDDEETNNGSSIRLQENDLQEQSNVEYVRVMTEYGQHIRDQPDDDEDEPDDGFANQTEISDPNKDFVVITKSHNEEEKTRNINTRQFDGMEKQFTEEDGIKRAIRRIKEMSKNGNLKIPNIPPHELTKQYLKPDDEKYPIVSLMTQSYYFAQEFIKAASDQEIPFSSISANILVDCSSFISFENKAFNMLIFCALTHALNALE